LTSIDFPSHILAAGDVVAVCFALLPVYVCAGAADDPMYGFLSFLSTDAAVGYPV